MKIYDQEMYQTKCPINGMVDKSDKPISDLGKQVVVEGAKKMAAPKKMEMSEESDY